MPAIDGFFPQPSLAGYVNLYLAADMDAYTEDWVGDPVRWAAGIIAGHASLVTHWPVSTTPSAHTGYIATSFYDDYYNRIHIAPRTIDIGNLLNVQTRQATIWNAYLTPQALSSVTESGTEGINESGITAPTTFAPIEERTIQITVDTNGPATINAHYTFHFPAESPVLTVTGRRVVVFGYAPNWSEPVRERMQWATDVLVTQSGIEQRVGLRAVPRRTLEYALLTQDRHASARLETILLGWQARIYALPVWTERQDLAAALPAGSTVVPCATSNREFSPDGLATLWRGHDQHEAVEVASVGASSITLKRGTTQAWPAGTRLYPVRLARLPQRQPLRRETDQLLSGMVSFDLVDHPGFQPMDSGDSYAGYRVYAGRINWSDPVEVETVRQLAVLDYTTGAPWVDDLSGLATILKSWHWTFGSRAEIVAFRQWLAARDGRRVPFWSVSQGDDLEVAAPIGSSDMSVTVRNIGYARYIDGRADRRHLVLTTRAGMRYYRAITAASEIDADTESLAIDAPLGATLQIGDIASLRFLHLTRLESDEIEIEWHTLDVATCSATLRSLPQ